MEHTMKKLTGATLFAALSVAGSVAHAQQTEQVKVGFAAPMTGAQAHYGKDMQNGIVLAIEDFNATKPVLGGKPVQIVLDTGDDQADPRTGTTVAQKLVDDGIKGMLGHFNSGTTIPASRIYANAGIAQIAMATAPEYTQQGYKTTFRMMTSDTQQGSVAGTFAARTLKLKKVVIIDDRTAYGQGLADQFEKAAKASGAKILEREYTNDKAVDFKAILTKVKSLTPDLVYYGGADAQAGPMVKQMKALGIKTPLMAGEMVKTDTFLKLAGDAANGTIASLAGLPLEEMPGGKDYVAKYKKRFGEEVQTYSPYAYDGAMALFEAMKKANSTDPAKYLPALARTDMSGVTAKHVAYDAKGDLKNGGITLYKVVNGQWTPLQSVGGK
ncbi:branched-chain amino acid ABC transporter substrate-binding protein [Mycetohabitans rhizoxinica]|uniref:Leucine-, isoleucine-, valine-, threonine-, and alanine-binding protein n=1 Tax=Mycetohabitans rhizoxinica (strain DSM 19002 / CIP 109453 / HKI 454) TaxID=882378 RepID=E5AKK9_MYCRK|nr:MULTISPECIES: branched-chain amino acid ABC transporter substrate-binding protein [Mycetohabitans]MCF7694642.1 branched-chain amino acid ABC transporter substrate-binding protein [Mycetohabitans sp. B2]MCG1046016.1 branched-chain amino acid ABC transporter substrate-binding protein [Mycetohabitans sp. B6]CBW73682.1 Leucine-, isoleucine-, valine-, threonine-, and alanine-binding protein [Mycetohabitans rhizoxinica HKI 454]